MKKLTKREKAKRKTTWKKVKKEYEKTNKITDYRTFKKVVRSYKEANGLTWEEAAKKVAHNWNYSSPEQIGKENILNSLKTDFRATYDELRRKMGRFKKGEHMIDRLSWDSQKKMWKITSSTGQEYWVDISNSPYQAYII